MNKVLIGWFWCIVLSLNAQAPIDRQLQEGDLIFQNVDCGAMCDAIEEVTDGVAGYDFSHVGLLTKQNGRWMIIEAISKGVCLTPLDSFMLRTDHPHVLGRVKKRYQKQISKAIIFALQQLGKSYDEFFIYDNGQYYCSELIYDAFKKANNDRPFFQLLPMTFKSPKTDDFYPVWVEYYKALDMTIPEGELGCNPGGLSKSKKIRILGEL